jgi:hypothetical protein
MNDQFSSVSAQQLLSSKIIFLATQRDFNKVFFALEIQYSNVRAKLACLIGELFFLLQQSQRKT